MDDDGLFRQEALRRFREGSTHGQVLRLAPGWTWLAVTLVLLAVGAVSLWAARAEVETRARFPAVVVENDGREVGLQVHPTPAQTAFVVPPGSPLVFHPASGGPGIPIGRLAAWDDRDPGAIVIRADRGPASLIPGTKGKVEGSTGRVRLLDVLRPGRR